MPEPLRYTYISYYTCYSYTHFAINFLSFFHFLLDQDEINSRPFIPLNLLERGGDIFPQSFIYDLCLVPSKSIATKQSRVVQSKLSRAGLTVQHQPCHHYARTQQGYRTFGLIFRCLSETKYFWLTFLSWRMQQV